MVLAYEISRAKALARFPGFYEAAFGKRLGMKMYLDRRLRLGLRHHAHRSGDISPQTFKGRVIAVMWMFISLVLVSTFTATMASILTAARLNQGSNIRGLDDFRQIHVGTFAKIQAVVYDEPFLLYVIRNQYADQFTVLPLNVDPQLYAFALREGSLCANQKTECCCARSMNRPGTTCFTTTWAISRTNTEKSP